MNLSIAVREGTGAMPMGRLLLLTGACSAAFGAAVGSYVGGMQIVYGAIKFPIFLLGTLAVCGSIMSLLAAGRWGVERTAQIAVTALWTTSVVLGAFAPIIFLAGMSLRKPESYPTMITIVTVAVGSAGTWATVRLKRAIGSTGLWLAWIGIYAFVGAQVVWLLKPWIGHTMVADRFIPLQQNLQGNFYESAWQSLPGNDEVTMYQASEISEFDRLNNQTLDGQGPWSLAGGMLRAPGAVIRKVGSAPDAPGLALAFMAVTIAFGATYGAVMGFHAAAYFAVLKIPLIIVGSCLLCSPTLFVFNALAGSTLTYLQTVTLVMMLGAMLSVVILAFAPIAWLFGVSTGAFGFMSALHLVIFAIAFCFGIRFMLRARAYLQYLRTSDGVDGRILAWWSCVIAIVGLQMAHYFRPILLPGPFHTGERGIFTDFLKVMFKG